MSENTYDQYQLRLAAVRAELTDWQVDGLLVGSSANRRWLSGFTGSAGWLLVTKNVALLGTDFRYWKQAARQAPHFELFHFKGQVADNWTSFLHLPKSARIGLEARHVTLSQFDEFQRNTDFTFVKLDRSLEHLRETKSEQELNLIRKAAAVTDSVMIEINQIAQVGMQERQLAWKLEMLMHERGAEGLAFPIIVAFGRNSALPHHQPGDRQLKEGDVMIVDMGAMVGGYASDLTRSFYVGTSPDPRFSNIHEIAQRAQTAALSGIRAGMTGVEADTLARNVIAKEGFGEAFGHSLGHGLGLDVHEGPSLSQTNGDRPLPCDAVVTVEPGIYLPDWGGVRIEDLVQITEHGATELSHCPKNTLISG